jgi:L-serine deaminase
VNIALTKKQTTARYFLSDIMISLYAVFAVNDFGAAIVAAADGKEAWT